MQKTEKLEKSEVQYFWRRLRRAVSALENLAHAAWNGSGIFMASAAAEVF
jgi:hypothetical protein